MTARLLCVLALTFGGVGCGSTAAETASPATSERVEPLRSKRLESVLEHVASIAEAIPAAQVGLEGCLPLRESDAPYADVDLIVCLLKNDAGLTYWTLTFNEALRFEPPTDTPPDCIEALKEVDVLNERHTALLERMTELPWAERAKLDQLLEQNERMNPEHMASLRRAQSVC